MSVEVVTFGCKLNSYESELIKKSASEAGLQNAIIFNSCAVTQEAERQLRQAINKAHRQDPNKKIIVTGCAVQINPDKYASMPAVTSVIGNTNKTQSKSYIIAEDTPKVLVNDIMSVKETAVHLVSTFDGKSRAFLEIQNGCNHRCTFCIIPYGRGNSRSVPIGEIVKQAEMLVHNGYNEIVLTGVDITDYGKDLPGSPTLGQMIKRLLSLVPSLKRLRLSSIDVAEVDNDLLDLIINEERFMPYLHLSLQAGDDMILKRMKRRHLRYQITDFCSYVKSKRSDVTFGADIIAGFPTEDHEMFLNTLRIVEELPIIWLHVFPYSKRPGTPAARMPQVEASVIKDRARQLRHEGARMLDMHYDSMIGKTVSAVIETNNTARSADFSLISHNQDLPKGSIHNFKIIARDTGSLIGQLE